MGKYKDKIYTLKNGDTVTAEEVMTKSGISKSAVYSRLKRGKSKEDVFRPVEANKAIKKDRSDKDIIYKDVPNDLFKLLFGSWNKGS
jgi:IS30 family transposase